MIFHVLCPFEWILEPKKTDFFGFLVEIPNSKDMVSIEIYPCIHSSKENRKFNLPVPLKGKFDQKYYGESSG